MDELIVSLFIRVARMHDVSFLHVNAGNRQVYRKINNNTEHHQIHNTTELWSFEIVETFMKDPKY